MEDLIPLVGTVNYELEDQNFRDLQDVADDVIMELQNRGKTRADQAVLGYLLIYASESPEISPQHFSDFIHVISMRVQEHLAKKS